MNEAPMPLDTPSSPGHAAIAYAAYGWAVFPCHVVLPNSAGCTCGFGDCASPAKHPVPRNGLKAATKDLDQVRAWWSRLPRANVGIRTGAESGLIVVDVDPAHGGLVSLRNLIRENGPLPVTTTVGTGSDGLHFYFRHPGGVIRNRAGSRLGPGLDIRGDGGYVIAPPSLHVSGKSYHWAADNELAELPHWIHERIIDVPRPRREQVIDTRSVNASAWAASALNGELRALQSAPEGTRNDVLNRAAFNLGQIVGGGALDRMDVENRLVRAGLAIGLTERECIATVTSGLSAGSELPRYPASRHAHVNTASIGREASREVEL